MAAASLRFPDNQNASNGEDSMKASTLLLAALLTVATSAVASAQDVKRTELKRSDLTGTNMEVIMSVVEAPPGAMLPKHFHHGEEAFYVLEGAMVEMPDGTKSDRAAGSGSINVRDVPHAGYKVTGDKTLKLLTVHVIDKGKPMSEPAK
jgi:quercetin dioxygenase-like cupin family protein